MFGEKYYEASDDEAEEVEREKDINLKLINDAEDGEQ
jgi:hypothetical protein